MTEWIEAGFVDEIPAGSRKFVYVEGKPVAVFNVEGQYYCIADLCTHDGGSLADGELDGYEIECPRHGALFDIRSGAALTFPATSPTPVYQVKVKDGRVLVSSQPG